MNKLTRNPKIVWRVEKQREAQVEQALSSGMEADEQGTVILIASGTMHQLNYVGGAIWQLCDGTRTAGAIVDQLLGEFDVERDELAADVETFVADLLEKGWLDHEK